MKRRTFIKGTAAAAFAGVLPWTGCERAPSLGSFSEGWSFRRDDPHGANAHEWTPVRLPHTARVEAAVTGPPGSESYQWQGLCAYQRILRFTSEEAARAIWLHFEAAMNRAEVRLDGELVASHLGGWMPFVVELTDRVRPETDHVLEVVLDNRDDPVSGPKPLEQLDFNMYGGLYRPVHRVIKDRLHITDAILADEPGSGGLFVTFPEVTPDRAWVDVQVHLRNQHASDRAVAVRVRMTGHGSEVREVSPVTPLAPGATTRVRLSLEIPDPRLWSPRHPDLYDVTAEILVDGSLVDAESVRVGIRRLELTDDGIRINGERSFLRGTNRHQEYPYIGYALSDAAQVRDARLIKEAGFDYIRLSHYAHAPAFMDACDELGLVVMNCIPGWQYFNRENPAFTALQYENARRLIRRDRNHPCVILWEVSLNESWMPDSFIADTRALAKEEYPGDQCITCGWQDGYDVFIQARQHGGCRQIADRPCLVSEYGDWEYYAMNAGLNQQAWGDLAADETNSRQLRWHGERALLQQATNFQEAHNDNKATRAFADGLWVMFDYNRGYAPDLESSGCADLFRVPKFSYHFFRSQRDPSERLDHVDLGPMVFVANHWMPGSDLTVRVFSNCEEVALSLNGTLIDQRAPDGDRLSTHLSHPPFTFTVPAFEPGHLEAKGYIDGQLVATHAVDTAGESEAIVLEIVTNGVEFPHSERDAAFIRASLVDGAGSTVPNAWENVSFGAIGPVAVVGPSVVSSEAGVASALIQANGPTAPFAVFAMALVGPSDRRKLVATSTGGPAATVHATDDGSTPTTGSPTIGGRIAQDARIRAILAVEGRVVAALDSAEPRVRLAGSAAPLERGAFHY